MNLNPEFETFLSNIEPDGDCVSQASEAHNSVRDYLKDEKDFKTLFKSSFLTGSYSRNTAIKEIKDVDIMIILNIEATESIPNQDINKIFTTLKNSLKNEYEIQQVEQQQRSVKLIWKFEKETDNDRREEALTLDLVPAIRSKTDSDYELWIPDKKQETWIKTNPKGHMDAVTAKNSESSKISNRGSFVPFVKTFKFWRDHTYKRPKRPKGFLLESLAYQYFEPCSDNWIDCVLKNIKSILNSCDMYKYVDSDEYISFIKDIGQEGEKICTSTTYSDFKTFLEKLEVAKNQIEEALDSEKSPDKYESIKRLQNVFGEEYFPAPKDSDRNIKNEAVETKNISILTGSSKNPEAKPYGQNY